MFKKLKYTKWPLLSSLILLTAYSSNAVQIYDQLPKEISADGKYVFYLHGYIVEGDNPRPVDNRFGWGLYDFPKIKEALSDPDYTLIATHRPKHTDPFVYANDLSEKIRGMLTKGVRPENITLIGFSRGAFITGLTSNNLSDIGVNTVILAGCGRLIASKHHDVQVYGHVLSMYEKSDRAASCDKLRKKSTSIKSFTELAIHTGLEHGAFYRPLQEWVMPVKNWIKSNKPP